MTLANSVVAKLSVAFVALATAFVFTAPAQAQMSETEMNAEIDRLTALIEQLTGSLGGDSMSGGSMSSSSVCPYTWARTLNMGATGPDVMKLQQFLNSDPLTRVAPAGSVGSAGMETDYYGPATGAAVAKFQEANRAAILSPLGLVNSTTFFGNSTMAEANRQCASAPTVPTTPTPGDDDGSMGDDDGDDGSSAGLSGGEADVNSFEFSDEEDETEEGEEDVPVLNIEFDVEDGDVSLERMDINFNNANIAGSAEDEPWDVFDEISVWVDGDKVASEDATDEDDWDDDGNDFEFRLTNIDTIFREDTTGEVLVAVSITDGVDVDNTPGNNEWDVNIPADGMRFVDSLGLDIEGPNSAGAASTFEVQEAGAGDDLDIEASDEDPEGETLSVDEDDEMEHLIFAFDLSADDSDGDVALDNYVSVNVLVGGTDGTSLNAFVDDFRLEIGGESFDAESYTGTGVTAIIDFDIDGDVVIEEEETVTAMLYANFDDVANSFSDATIQASTSAAQIDAEGDSSGENITVGGSDVEGEEHTARLDGVTVDLVSEDTELKENTESTTADDEGVFTLEFDVTAFGDDVYLPFGASTSTDLTSAFEFSILDNDNNAVDLTGATITVSVDVDDSDSEKDNSYKVDEEGTERFTLEVEYDPATSGSYKLRLDTVNFAVTDVATATEAQDVSDQDIDTGKLTI